MLEKQRLVQSTVRLDPIILNKAQYYLRSQDVTITAFMDQKLREFIVEFERQYPQMKHEGLLTAPITPPRKKRGRRASHLVS